MIFFIVNLSSGTGTNYRVWRQVKDFMAKEKVPYKAYRTKYKRHASRLAEHISDIAIKGEDKDVRLVVVGGDGTFNEVINGIKCFDKIKLGIIPAGSGNDFAKGIGICKDVEKNLRNIISGKSIVSLDLGEVIFERGVKPRYFAISSGIGMDAIVCKKALHSRIKKILNKVKLGKLTYLALTVSTLFSMKTVDLEITVDGKDIEYKKLIFMAAMNLMAEGGGVPIAPSARQDDGKLSFCAAWGIGKCQAFLVLPLLALGKHEKLKCFDFKNGEEVLVRASSPVVLHADGEYCGDVNWAAFRCIPRTMNVFV